MARPFSLMRMLTAWAVAASCGLSCTEDTGAPAATTEDASPESKGGCCALDAPSCNCVVFGTRPDGSCETVCDAAPVGWTLETDERGCPRYRTGSASCLKSTPWDSGSPSGDVPVAPEPAATPQFDPPGGAFLGPFEVRITTTSVEQFIYYTTDGTTPNRTSTKLTTPRVALTKSTVLKAIAVSDNLDRWLPSEVATGTFVVSAPDAAASD